MFSGKSGETFFGMTGHVNTISAGSKTMGFHFFCSFPRSLRIEFGQAKDAIRNLKIEN